MKIYTVFVALILSFAIKGKAQEAITLNECKQKALAHNQTIKVKKANYKASEAEVKINKRASLPNIDFDASYLYQNDPMQMHIPGYELPTVDGNPSGVYSPENTSNLQYHNSYNANVGVSLPLYLGGKLTQSRKIADYAKAIAESDLALSQTNILLSIEQQYWTLVSLIETDKVNKKSIRFLADVVTDMENRFIAGIVTKNEVLKAKVELNNAKLYQILIHDNIELSKMALNQSIGIPINESLNIADTTIEVALNFDLLDFPQQNPENRKELTILVKQTKIAKSESKIVKANYQPQLVSFANYFYQNPNHLAQADGELTWNAGVTLSIPIYHWGERKLKSTKTQMKIASAEYAFEQTKELLTLEIHQAIFKLKESITKMHFTAEALEQAEENLNLENNRLQEDVSTTTDLLNAQMQWQKAQADYISAKTDVKISEAFYKKSIGELNP